MSRRSASPALPALLILILLCLSSACASLPEASPRPARLILVSLDGTAARYLGAGHTPVLDALAADGARARWMNPSYPSLTFPNHYTLVTGLRPDHHGIVNNTMRDPALGRFTIHDPEAVGNAHWWDGTPLWVGAQRAGLRTAAMFWPGTEAAIDGVRPDTWTPFDPELTPEARVERVLGWLDRPPASRPDFITLYFEHVDTAGHYSGPDSQARIAATERLDAAIGLLVDGLRERGLYEDTNIVVVSDHGMAATSLRRLVFLDDLVDLDDWTVVTQGTVVGLAPRSADAAFPKQDPHLTCWRKQELPARWHYGTHPRVPPVLCQAALGWKALARADLLRMGGRTSAGEHGFDPAEPSMGAIFIAHGPAFARGVVLEPFDNVDVYPLLAALLGVEPAPNDGDAAHLREALR
ncbi:ectonucleotide pyrophosphatase/phosphodiesterase [Coralloluteibacterium stylophorae]|uniref:Alkaline phosphatase family protein n=1 Tax=Coralloluteibacterium stylophorae TaxID=1776034 RepID=A0A8J8B0S9_9GAMM|nr:ectonucleotide pyrophosphatase/phosphodiesterase [Coralloluteibacterium stylophorae]MBS7456521.1 alkaline phosphatase family protein [Coralloluteibacterium stylophorae]